MFLIWRLFTWSSCGHIVSKYPWYSTFLVFIYYSHQKICQIHQYSYLFRLEFEKWCNYYLLRLKNSSSVWFLVSKLKTTRRNSLWHLAAAMSEQLKYIVDELNKEPFKKNYNLIRYFSHYSFIIFKSSITHWATS